MAKVLVVADAEWVRSEVIGPLARRGLETLTTADSRSVLALCDEHEPDLVITDSQVGSMGFVAVCRAVKSAERGGTLPDIGVLALLDRRPDVFLARRGGADAWLVKPFEPAALRWTVSTLLAGQDWDEVLLADELAGTRVIEEIDEIVLPDGPPPEAETGVERDDAVSHAPNEVSAVADSMGGSEAASS